MLLRAGVRGHVARLKCSGSQPVPFQTLCTWSNHRGLENIAIYMSGSSLVIQMVKTLPAVHIGDPGDPCSILGSERSPEEGNGNPLQYSYLENPMDREAWWATIYRVAKRHDCVQACAHTCWGRETI